jgi:hypothetical protein
MDRKPFGAAAGKVDDDDEDQAVVVEVNIHFDDPSIEQRVEEDKEEGIAKRPRFGSNEERSMVSNVYSEDVIYAPDNIIFNFQLGVCLGYMLSLKNYTSMGKSSVRIFKSLLLRTDSKLQALRYIKYLVLRKTPLEIITKVFLKINGVYKDATKERQKKSEAGNNSEANEIIRTSTVNVGGPANQILRTMSLAVANGGRNTLPSYVGSSRLSNEISSH